ncbi:MAG TPA: alpha/beta hydrolase [Solirubrobacteraceae bacterium]|jgi:pimeloyl-ACP methyl ester carboxylesterase
MRRKATLTALLAAVTAAVGIAATAGPAAAATSSIPFTTCADAPTFGCGHLIVPLDPTGAIPGTVSLAIRRQLSATGAATTAIVALAGGPGQAALPFAATASQIVSDGLATDDLIVFDQRGTGDSGPLACTALNSFTQPLSVIIPNCAAQIGATRGLYTTDDTVADIEALRQALGYTKLVLYGTSYGTKVALRYAAAYPQNVAGLILDSTVLPNGPDVFDQSSYQAVPRILKQICAAGACAGIVHPVADLRKVLERVDRKPARTIFTDSTGKKVRVKIGPDGIASILLAGDDDPSLRADFPAAVATAAHGQYALLGVLYAHAVLGETPDATIDNPLYFDTECEELAFPWTRTETGAQRFAAALAYAKAQPKGTYGPFDALTAFQESSTPDCAYWPFASAAPEPQVTTLPDVPTVIISGADDLRTPTSNARVVAAMIPDAKVVVVPQTGHSVLTTEFGSCARDAVDAFFTPNATIDTVCRPLRLPAYLEPAPAAPGSLALVAPLNGLAGASGRAARAFELTLGWSSRELSESLFETLIGSNNPAFSKGLGGLHGGYAKLTTFKTGRSKITFHDFSYIPGLTLTGKLSSGIGELRFGGKVSGSLDATTANHFAGKLGGVKVHFAISGATANALAASAAR